jgi:hypothetical protein
MNTYTLVAIFCKNSFKAAMGKEGRGFYLSKYKKNKHVDFGWAIFALKLQHYGYRWLF